MGLTHGLAEYIAQEEMGRSHGFWWSPDSRFGFEEVDETHIPVYRIVHQGKEPHRRGRPGRPPLPVSPGRPTPACAWASFHLAEGANHRSGWTWARDDIYLARVGWLPDGSLAAAREPGADRALELVRFDPHSGAAQRSCCAKTSAVWINLHDLFKPAEERARLPAELWGLGAQRLPPPVPVRRGGKAGCAN
jgi:dipeptidyl-peptidase 4